MSCDELQALMQSYVDGELDSVSAMEVEQHLQGCRSCALACDDLQRLKTALRDRSLYARAPLALQRRLEAAIAQEHGSRPATATRGTVTQGAPQLSNQVTTQVSADPKPSLPQVTRSTFNLSSFNGLPGYALRLWQPSAGRWRRVTATVVTAALICLALVTWGWRQRAQTDAATERITQEIVTSHVHSLLANHLTDLDSSDPHTVQSWFPGKVPFAVAVAQPSPPGSRLLGARLDYVASKPLAALIYTQQQHIINVFIGPSSDEAGRKTTANPPSATGSSVVNVQTYTSQGYHLCRMVQGGLTYWVVSDLETVKLVSFAKQIIPSVSNHCA